MLTRTVASKLAPVTGRKNAQSVGQGLSSGAIGGAAEGALRSAQEHKNPLKTITQDAAIGAFTGAGLGAVGSNVQKAVRVNDLKKVNFNQDLTKQELKIIRQKSKNYYNDFIKGTSIVRDDVGKILFGNAGIDELTSRGLQNVKTLPNLKSQIKNGDLKSPTNNHLRNDITKFDIIENILDGKTYEYQIADDIATGKKFYFAKDITNKKNLSSTDRNKYQGSKIDSSLIIPDNIPKLNSFDEWLKELRRKRGH